MPWEVGRGSGPVPPVSVEPKQTLKTDRRGAVIVEMALVLPLLVTLLLGLVCYGQYFLIANRVQQIANDAARATIGGRTSAERNPLPADAADDAATITTVIEIQALYARYSTGRGQGVI